MGGLAGRSCAEYGYGDTRSIATYIYNQMQALDLGLLKILLPRCLVLFTQHIRLLIDCETEQNTKTCSLLLLQRKRELDVLLRGPTTFPCYEH